MKANRKFKEGQEAVSAVIGVILMVAITVAIAATVYVYVSGMVGGQTGSTPTIGLTATPIAGGSCTIQIATASSPNINWTSVTTNLNNITGGTKVTLGVTPPTTGNIAGGDLIRVTGLKSGQTYSLTVTYKATGGSMGTVTWTQI